VSGKSPNQVKPAVKKPDPDKVVFTFDLTARQAQEIFNLLECYREEPVFRDIWNTNAKRLQARMAVRRFSNQLNRQYAETGVEV
jgi:hypothetical protein